MYVRVLRVLPDVATVADRSFKNRVEVIDSATLDKRTIDVRVVGVMETAATCNAHSSRTSRLMIIVQQTYIVSLPCERK